MMQLILLFLRDVVVLFPAFRELLLLPSSRTDPVDFYSSKLDQDFSRRVGNQSASEPRPLSGIKKSS